MNPTVKKVVAGVALKEVADRVQARRRAKRSVWSRLSRKLAVLGAGGAVFYLYKTGKLQDLVGQAKALSGPPAQPGQPTDYASQNGSGADDVTYRSEDEPIGTPVT